MKSILLIVPNDRLASQHNDDNSLCTSTLFVQISTINVILSKFGITPTIAIGSLRPQRGRNDCDSTGMATIASTEKRQRNVQVKSHMTLEQASHLDWDVLLLLHLREECDEYPFTTANTHEQCVDEKYLHDLLNRHAALSEVSGNSGTQKWLGLYGSKTMKRHFSPWINQIERGKQEQMRGSQNNSDVQDKQQECNKIDNSENDGDDFNTLEIHGNIIVATTSSSSSCVRDNVDGIILWSLEIGRALLGSLTTHQVARELLLTDYLAMMNGSENDEEEETTDWQNDVIQATHKVHALAPLAYFNRATHQAKGQSSKNNDSRSESDDVVVQDNSEEENIVSIQGGDSLGDVDSEDKDPHAKFNVRMVDSTTTAMDTVIEVTENLNKSAGSPDKSCENTGNSPSSSAPIGVIEQHGNPNVEHAVKRDEVKPAADTKAKSPGVDSRETGDKVDDHVTDEEGHSPPKKRAKTSPNTLSTQQTGSNWQTNENSPKPAIASAHRMMKLVFTQMVWPNLEKDAKWRKEMGTRAHDIIFLPPGVKRGKGAKIRVDYFDSRKGVMMCVNSMMKANKKSTTQTALPPSVVHAYNCYEYVEEYANRENLVDLMSVIQTLDPQTLKQRIDFHQRIWPKELKKAGWECVGGRYTSPNKTLCDAPLSKVLEHLASHENS